MKASVRQVSHSNLLCLALCAFLVPTFCLQTPSDCPNTLVSYELTVYTFWSQQAFPKHFPDTRPVAQWSKLYGVSHGNNLTLFQVGSLADKPLQQFAELGRTDEFESALNHSLVLSQFYAPPIKKGVGVTSTRFFVDTEHAQVSFVMKIHPSPDWFIGMDRMSLCRNGTWLENTTIDAVPMDAGTDQGFTFTSPDYANEDPEAVFTINSSFPREPYGSFYYRNLTTLPLMAQFVISKEKQYTKRTDNPKESETCPEIKMAFESVSKTILQTTNDLPKSDRAADIHHNSTATHSIDIKNGSELIGKHQVIDNLSVSKKNNTTNEFLLANESKFENTSRVAIEGSQKNIKDITNDTNSRTEQSNNIHPLETILRKVEVDSDNSAENTVRSSTETSGEFITRKKRRKNRRYMKSMVDILNQMLNEDQKREGDLNKDHKNKESVKILSKEKSKTDRKEGGDHSSKDDSQSNGSSKGSTTPKPNGTGGKSKSTNAKNSKKRHEKSKPKKGDSSQSR